MGGYLSVSWFWDYFSPAKETKVLMLGLDYAGKSTIIYKLKLGFDQACHTTATIGSMTEFITYKNLKILVMEIGGQKKTRSLWAQFFEGMEAVVFVLDSTDRSRISEAREELLRLMGKDDDGKSTLNTKTFLILANKQDLPEAMSVDEIVRNLGLDQTNENEERKMNDQQEARGGVLWGRTWHVQPVVAETGDGLHKALDWLLTELKKIESENENDVSDASDDSEEDDDDDVDDDEDSDGDDSTSDESKEDD